MSISWTQLYSATHQFSEGAIAIASSFVGNVLAVKVQTKPEYELTKQIIGYIFQDSSGARKGYALYSGNDVLLLSLPETSALTFFPTSFLSDSYSLELAYTSVGNLISPSEDPVILDSLGLASSVSDLWAALNAINWSTLSGKPSYFPPDEHQTLIGDVTDLASRLSDIDDLVASKASSGNLASLAGRVETLESATAFSGSYTDLTDKPDTFPPSAHSHEISEITGLSSALSDKANSSDVSTLAGRVATLEGATPSSGATNYISISTNQTLEVNKNYFASVSGLVCALPSSPAIGDLVNLATGNFDFRVNHGNSSQTVRNLSTGSTVGTGSGIILKPYSQVTLMFAGSNLWVSGYRARTINNWLNATLTNNVLQSYTPTLESGVSAAFGTVNSIKDGTKTPNFVLSDSLGLNASINQTRLIYIALSSPKELDRIIYWAGQGNTGAAGNEVNSPNEMKVYSGTGTANLLATFTLVKTRGLAQTFNLSLGGNTHSNYTLAFTNSEATSINMMEIELYGKEVTGGEIVAT